MAERIGAWWRDKQLRLAVVFTFAWMACAHAYRWFNGTAASHDGLAFSHTAAEAAHQVSLGRFLEPVYVWLRGEAAAPFLVGLLSCLFVAASVYLIVRMLKIDSAFAIACVAGVMSTSIAVTLMNVSYTNWLDVDMLALLCSVAAVFSCARWRWGFLPGALLLAASMGLYQSYLQMFISLALIYVAFQALGGDELKEVLTGALKLLGCLVLGMVVYVAAMNAAMALLQVSATDGYNGLSGVGDYSEVSFVGLLAKAYALPLLYSLMPETHFPVLAGLLNVALAIAAIAGVIVVCKRERLRAASIALIALCVLLLPLACACVYVISRGEMHGLMIHSFSAFYLFAIGVVCLAWPRGAKTPSKRALPMAVCGMLAVVMVGNVVYSNDLYLRKDLESFSTLSTMTRIADRVEQMEGYVPAETQVVFVGRLIDSDYSLSRPEMPPYPITSKIQELTGSVRSTGFYGDFATTYLDTYSYYLAYIMGVPVKVAPEEVAAQFAEESEVEEMQPFPSTECCRWVDGSVVVKLS